MFVRLVLLSCLLSYFLTIKITLGNVCEKVNLCSIHMKSCHAVILKCQNGSCRFRRFNIHDHQHLNLSRWFYDSYQQRCRRYHQQIENFVYFRFLRDCRRLCPIVAQKRNDAIITLQVADEIDNYNNTFYANLDVDLSPNWVKRLANLMDLTTDEYHAQKHYFENYRRRFTNFADAPQVLMPNYHHYRNKNNKYT